MIGVSAEPGSDDGRGKMTEIDEKAGDARRRWAVTHRPAV